MQVTISFEASLSEQDSGACFTVLARDQAHARQVVAWLRSKVQDKTKTFVTASIELPPQHVTVEVPDGLCLRPCQSPYCECEVGKCATPGCYDARGTT
jgi:hypothetical protein